MPTKSKTLSVAQRRDATKSGRSSLALTAYAQIRDEILRGHFGIGDILSRRRLAGRLHMSFVPITEALQRLEAEGLVESRPRIGTRVRIPTEENIRGSCVIREALESQSARLCAENITTEEKTQLRKIARHLDQLYLAALAENADTQFLFSVHTYHMQFHMRIAEFARCPALSQAIEKEQVLVFNWLYDTATGQTALPRNFHTNLADAICSGSISKADEAMRAHVRYGLSQVLERFNGLVHSNTWRSRSTSAVV